MDVNLGNLNDQRIHDSSGHPLMEGEGRAGRRRPCPVQEMFHVLVEPRHEISFSSDVKQVLMEMAVKIGIWKQGREVGQTFLSVHPGIVFGIAVAGVFTTGFRDQIAWEHRS